MQDTPSVNIAKALADPTRLRMIHEIRAAGEMTCSQIVERFDLSQPTISHHIKTLASASLINMRQQGQFHVISVNEETLREFARSLTAGA